jgi:hypothetical protein
MIRGIKIPPQTFFKAKIQKPSPVKQGVILNPFHPKALNHY